MLLQVEELSKFPTMKSEVATRNIQRCIRTFPGFVCSIPNCKTGGRGACTKTAAMARIHSKADSPFHSVIHLDNGSTLLGRHEPKWHLSQNGLSQNGYGGGPFLCRWTTRALRWSDGILPLVNQLLYSFTSDSRWLSERYL